jgi:DNA polymerase V
MPALRTGAGPVSAPLTVIALCPAAEAPSRHLLRLFESVIPAGFPSPAEGYLEDELDLNDLVVRNAAATFLLRVAGESMTGAGIHDGDLLVVDRSEAARPGRVVIAVVDGEFTVKRLAGGEDRLWLQPEHPDYPPIAFDPTLGHEIWGVVTFVLHRP